MRPPEARWLRRATLVLFTCFVQSAQGADGVVVTREVYLYKKPDADLKGGAVVAKLQVGDALLPARENKGQPYVTETTCFSFHMCVDRFDDALNPSKYFVLAFLGKDRGGWEKGWVDKAACEKFSYEPTFKKVACSADAVWEVLEPDSYAKGALLKMDEIRFRDFKPPQIANTRPFARPFSEVWTAIVEILAERQLPFELVDKDSEPFAMIFPSSAIATGLLKTGSSVEFPRFLVRESRSDI